MKGKKDKKEGERERKGEREVGRVQRADTVVKEPSSSLHLDTHKYKTQPFELNRGVGEQCSRFFFLQPFSLSSSFLSSHIGAANLFHVPTFSGPFTIFGHALASDTDGHWSPKDTTLSHS